MIRRALAALALVVPALSLAADPAPADGFDFQSVEVSTAISLYLKEVSKQPYMLCGDVLADQRKVSIRASGKTLTGPLFAALLASHGFQATDRGGVVVVCKKEAMTVAEDGESFLYRVRHRDSAYLVDLLAPLVKGVFANQRAVVGAMSVGGDKDKAAGQSPQGAPVGSTMKPTSDDYIIFNGSPKETAKLEKLLAQVDVAMGEVSIKAYMYEVGSSDSDASALGLVMSALGGRVQAGIAGNALGDFVRLKTGSIDLVASALQTDGRFKVVTAPYQRVRSGKTARFVSGSQVSILGAIITNQTGTQQSYDRVESGTILEISPVVRDGGVDVDLFQQVSSFVAGSGSAQPTLNKRELRTSLTVQDGEVVVIAGLDDSKEDQTKSGLSFLPFSLSKSKAISKSQLVLLLEIKRL